MLGIFVVLFSDVWLVGMVGGVVNMLVFGLVVWCWMFLIVVIFVLIYGGLVFGVFELLCYLVVKGKLVDVKNVLC